jgi:hypothetical protein
MDTLVYLDSTRTMLSFKDIRIGFYVETHIVSEVGSLLMAQQKGFEWNPRVNVFSVFWFVPYIH